jgi:hypothetical protein
MATSNQQATLAFGAVVGTATCAALYLLNRLRRAGAFQVLVFDWKELPSDRTIMFKPFKGAYKEVQRGFDETMALTAGFYCPSESWGLYFDDPKQVGASNCRWSIGVVMDGKKTEKLEELLAAKGYIKINNIPSKVKCLHTSFPFTGPLSIMLGVFRIYPAFAGACKRYRVDPSTNKTNKSGFHVEIVRPLDGIAEYYFVSSECEELLRVSHVAQ